jgi:hypothetical protein
MEIEGDERNIYKPFLDGSEKLVCGEASFGNEKIADCSQGGEQGPLSVRVTKADCKAQRWWSGAIDRPHSSSPAGL